MSNPIDRELLYIGAGLAVIALLLLSLAVVFGPSLWKFLQPYLLHRLTS